MDALPFELTFASYKTLPVNTRHQKFRYSHRLSIKNFDYEGEMDEWEIAHVLHLKRTRWSVRTFVYVSSRHERRVFRIVIDDKDVIHRIDIIDEVELKRIMDARDTEHLGIDSCPIGLNGEAEQYGYKPIDGDQNKQILFDRGNRPWFTVEHDWGASCNNTRPVAFGAHESHFKQLNIDDL